MSGCEYVVMVYSAVNYSELKCWLNVLWVWQEVNYVIVYFTVIYKMLAQCALVFLNFETSKCCHLYSAVNYEMLA
jgi:uncharacterized membrane protein (UPF0182 family)